MDSSTCMELALEGERLCKTGDFSGGVAFFEAAVQVGTNDMKTLSAVYSQLGNAYFYLSNYQKAMEFHKLDLNVARSIGDRMGEAKASGNLGNTLKMLGRFDEAVMCCKRHLEISMEMDDKIGEGRAMYNLGNVYHTKGKSLAKLGPIHQDPGEFSDEAKNCLTQAVEYYKKNLDLMIQLGDKSAQGRAVGNLGNTYYLLGDFNEAVKYHQERLKIAAEFSDKSAERRAHCNLGNAHIFLGEFEKAVDHYKQTLEIACELNDRIVEAQACYSLGNTFTLLRDYKSAVEYHLRHLAIAQELRDRIGEGRACWSLGNALTAIGDHSEAMNYAQKHFEISKEIGDLTGEATAQMSITDLRKLIETNPAARAAVVNEDTTSQQRHHVGRTKRLSMEQMELVKMTPDEKKKHQQQSGQASQATSTLQRVDEGGSSSEISIHSRPDEDMPSATSSEGYISKSNEDFLDMLSKYQSKRMDDQRCALIEGDSEGEQVIDTNSLTRMRGGIDSNKENRQPSCSVGASGSASGGSSVRSGVPRMGTRSTHGHAHSRNSPPVRSMSHDTNMLRTAQLATGGGGSVGAHPIVTNPIVNRNQQKNINNLASANSSGNNSNNNRRLQDDRAGSIPQISPNEREEYREELFDLIAGMQERRMDDQRAALPPIRRNSATNGPESLPGQSQRHRFVNFNAANVNAIVHNNPRENAIANPNANARHNAPSAQQHNHHPHPGRQMSLGANVLPDDDFFEMLMRCQSSRLEDQRACIPDSSAGSSSECSSSQTGSQVTSSSRAVAGSLERPTSVHGRSQVGTPTDVAPTVPDEDFFSLILRFQTAGRIDDQRTALPLNANAPSLSAHSDVAMRSTSTFASASATTSTSTCNTTVSMESSASRKGSTSAASTKSAATSSTSASASDMPTSSEANKPARKSSKKR